MPDITLTHLQKMKQRNEKIAMLTCYDAMLTHESSRAGVDTDGQVLVLHDMLGLSITGRAPKFVRNFLSGQESIQAAIQSYVAAVKDRSFPAAEHCYAD